MKCQVLVSVNVNTLSVFCKRHYITLTKIFSKHFCKIPNANVHSIVIEKRPLIYTMTCLKYFKQIKYNSIILYMHAATIEITHLHKHILPFFEICCRIIAKCSTLK